MAFVGLIFIVSIFQVLAHRQKYDQCENIIQNLPMDPSTSDIENSICMCGLFPYVPKFISEFPTSLRPYMGKGIGMWQYPIQYSQYIQFVRLFPIQTYVEIGVAAGGTFIYTTEMLRKFNVGLRGYAVDIAPIGYAHFLEESQNPFKGILADYIQNHDYVSFINGDSAKFMEQNPNILIDVLLIDGDHTKQGVLLDFQRLSGRSKVIVFHDVMSDECVELMHLWEDVKGSYPLHTIEFTEQYEELHPRTYLGIGVLVNPHYYDCHYEDCTDAELCDEMAKNMNNSAEKEQIVFHHDHELFLCRSKSRS